jgi:protein-disulfide isomerase
MKRLSGGLVVGLFMALTALTVAGFGGGRSEAIQVKQVGSVEKLLAGKSQQGLILGDTKAPVELIEFSDLQCPVCKDYSEQILPHLIKGPVSKGKVKIAFRNFTVISPQSVTAGTAALAAGAQGRGWNFIQLFYRNQGTEASGYVTSAFLKAIAAGAGVPNIALWNQERNSAALKKEVRTTTRQAEGFAFIGAPSFAVEGPGTHGLELLGAPGHIAPLEAAVKRAE